MHNMSKSSGTYRNRKKANRVQIFLSFDALKGFRVLLKEQEKVIIAKKRRILSEDELQELDYRISQIRTGMIIEIIYFEEKEQAYIKLEGMVSKIDMEKKTIQIVKKIISTKDIIEIGSQNDICS